MKQSLFVAAFAFTRLVMGAHYLSGVTAGGVIAFSCTLIGIAFYEKFSDRIIAR